MKKGSSEKKQEKELKDCPVCKGKGCYVVINVPISISKYSDRVIQCTYWHPIRMERCINGKLHRDMSVYPELVYSIPGKNVEVTDIRIDGKKIKGE